MKKIFITLSLTMMCLFVGFATQAQRTAKKAEIRAFVKAEKANYAEIPAVITNKVDYFMELMTSEITTLSDHQERQVETILRRYYAKQFAFVAIRNEFNTDYDQLMAGQGKGYDAARQELQSELNDMENILDSSILTIIRRTNFDAYSRSKAAWQEAVIERYGE